MGPTWCRICGRLLTVPKSVERGIGPLCWVRLDKVELSDEALEVFEKAMRRAEV